MPVVYTVITNGYDTLREPLVVSKGWRYVCFSDQPLKSKTWEIVPFHGPNRLVKIKGHEYFNDQLTLYIDGNFQIMGDLNKFLKASKEHWFSIAMHTSRHCLYDEIAYLCQNGRVNKDIAEAQVRKYQEEGFPKDYGLRRNGILLRDFRNKDTRSICDMWWEEFINGIPRDQASLAYCFWKYNTKPGLIARKNRVKYFKKNKHLWQTK